jgi:hypothetical protein
MKTLNLLFLLFPFFALSQTSLNGTLGESSQQIDGRYYDVYEIKVANTSLKSVEIAIQRAKSYLSVGVVDAEIASQGNEQFQLLTSGDFTLIVTSNGPNRKGRYRIDFYADVEWKSVSLPQDELISSTQIA